MMGFVEFAQAHGLIIGSLPYDRWVRTPTIDHPRSRNGAFFYGGDYGFIQNWADMTEVAIWHSDKPMTPKDRAEQQKRIEASKKAYAAERMEKQAKAANKARWILNQTELDRHGYLERKGFGDMQGNVWKHEGQDPLLVVPMTLDGKLTGCQLIGSTGEKKFLTGQRTNDSCFVLGQTGRKIICEGYATALSINAVLIAAKIPATIYATFSVGNATRVAKKHPEAFWIADNDHSGVGQKSAAESGCKWWIPPEVGTDANDWHMKVGLFKAAMTLKMELFKK